MKASLLFLSILLMFSTNTIQAQQSSTNFYNQFKDILNSQWYQVKGDNVLKKEESGTTTATYYNCKKELQGFSVVFVSQVTKNGYDVSKKNYVLAYRESSTNNEQIYSQVVEAFYNFNRDAWNTYKINNTPIVTNNKTEKRKIEINKGTNSTVATLYNDNSLLILISF
ncbi:MAG: hypothetical protein LC122_15015 [Chitinophagales bacterium]|nr:hypothetical protein [Chitinophagales bacterium]